MAVPPVVRHHSKAGYSSRCVRFCDQALLSIPYYTQIKLSGSYALPWALQVSGSFQSYPGDARNSTVDGTTALNNGTVLAEDAQIHCPFF